MFRKFLLSCSTLTISTPDITSEQTFGGRCRMTVEFTAERLAMAIKKLMKLALVVSFVACTSVATAQVIPTARMDDQPANAALNTGPFVAPGTFDYDAQMFAPVEFTNSEELEPSVGFYFVYDRMYTSISKAGARIPDDGTLVSVSVPRGSNYIWGNRYELGWMSDQGDGWGVNFERSNGSFFSAGQNALVSNPMQVETTFTNVEVNRMFRQPLSRGGHIEPYIGMRYQNVSDNTIEDTGIGPTNNNRFIQRATNSVIAAQAGARYTARTGRFRTSLDTSIATGYNRQSYFSSDLQVQTTGGPLVTEFNDSDSSFVPTLDFRADISYNLSRDVGLRTGFQVQYLWDGIARADTLTTALNSNSAFGVGTGVTGVFDESLIATGFTFGIEWKR